MVKTLTPKQRSAIERAKQNPDLQPILFRRAVGLHWFSAFREAGFLNPTKIPVPMRATEDAYVNIPGWPITDYLVATSAELLDPENQSYAVEFVDFIRAATNYAREHKFGNSRVWWQFSKIIPNLPPSLIRADDIAIFDYWLDDLYERGFVAENLGEHWLIGLLDRGDEHSKVIAIRLLEILYKTKTVDKQSGGKKETLLRFDSWHAKKMTKKVADKAGRVLGLPAVELFKSRLEPILIELNNDRYTSIWRPAIEDHGQNPSPDDVKHIVLEGYRDSLLGHLEEAMPAAQEHVQKILESPLETLQRIGIYAVDQRYQQLNHLIERVIRSQYFSSNFRHEMWHLLHNHYPQFSGEEKALVQKVIAGLVVVGESGQQSDSSTSYRRSTWLSAIKDYGEDVASLYRKNVEIVGGEPEHPDFSSYMTSGAVIDNESPISKDELLSLDVEQLVKRLESYTDSGCFGEPGIEGLVKVLNQIVKTEPLRFYNHLHLFSQLDLVFLYEMLEAYGELWREKVQLPWEELWVYLLEFCEDIVSQERFWSAENARRSSQFVANRYWIVGEIARLIESGLMSDDHPIPEKVLPQAERILRMLLQKEEGEEFKPDTDAVSTAINSPRGRCVEALINLTLHHCRLADKRRGEHVETWSHFQPLYEAELARADNGEYEFVTLVARYLPQFLYMSKDWALANLEKIFDQENYQKWLCAMQGYAHVNSVYEEVYNFMKRKGYFICALEDENIREIVDDKIVQNVAVAYLRDFESLEDQTSVIHQLLTRRKYSELHHLIWFLWTLRQDANTKIRSKIFELWPRIISVIDLTTPDGRQLASSLCDWTVFVDEVNDTNRRLILTVAPYADVNYHSHDLLRTIARISDRQPLEAYEIWRRLLEGSYPDYPPDAIEEALVRLVRIGPEGERKAKDIVSQYLRVGNDMPFKVLQAVSAVDESVYS